MASEVAAPMVGSVSTAIKANLASANWFSLADIFTNWYNEKHHHSAIKFVTPGQRHRGEDSEILAQRMLIYEKAKEKHPERWTSTSRNWDRPDVVTLNHTRKNNDQAILELKEAA